jgi:hypothetical protein
MRLKPGQLVRCVNAYYVNPQNAARSEIVGGEIYRFVKYEYENDEEPRVQLETLDGKIIVNPHGNPWFMPSRVEPLSD